MTTPLPPNDPSRSDEQLPGEAELAALYRELPQNEPSPALDAAVLRAAAQALGASVGPVAREQSSSQERRNEVHPKPLVATTVRAMPSQEAAARRRRVPRWMITLGSAASLVLVAGLAWRLHESSPLPSAPVAQEASTGAVSTAAKAAPEMAPLAAPMTPVVSSEAAAPASAQFADQHAAMRVSAAKKLKHSDTLQSAQRKAATGSMAAPPPLAERAAPALPPPAPPAPPSQITANAMNGQRDKVDQAAAPIAAAPMATNEAASATDTSQQPGDTPAQELDKIRQLLDQGHRAEALPRLRAFRLAHPQWPLSPVMQAQLQEP